MDYEPDTQPSLNPKQAADGWIVGGTALFVFGFLTLEILSNFEPAKLGAVFMLLSWPVLLALHEGGHAVVASALGFRVCRIVIGFGRSILLFRVGSVPVEVRLFPVSGYVVPAPTELRRARLKSSIIYAAGPGAELLLLLLILAIAGSELTEPSAELHVLLLQGTAAAILLGLFFNLIPFPLEGGGVTDGLGMIVSFFRSESFLRCQIALPFRMDAERMRAEGRPDVALTELRRAATRHPDNIFLRMHLATELLEQDVAEEAGRALEPLLDNPSHTPSERTAILVLLARAARLLGGDDALSAAEDYLERAAKVLPNDPSLKLETVAVRLTQSRIHDALRILNELDIGDPDGVIALEADFRRGELETLRGHTAEARDLIQSVRRRGGGGRELVALERRLGIDPKP